MKFKVMFNFLLQQMYSKRRGNGQNHPRQNPPGQNPREQLRENLYRGLLSGFFVLGILKVGGSKMCVVLLGVPGCVTKCDRRRGSKLARNSVTYFMGGPQQPHLIISVTRWR